MLSVQQTAGGCAVVLAGRYVLGPELMSVYHSPLADLFLSVWQTHPPQQVNQEEKGGGNTPQAIGRPKPGGVVHPFTPSPEGVAPLPSAKCE